ncbi:MAG TPA: glycosyltransferase family 9 protein [bacterium]|nr:glycosyltransferase family 9 protein [bacterium]
MTRYIYRKRRLRLAAALFDIIGGGVYRLLGLFRRNPDCALESLPDAPKIALVRLDGIGDILAALPAARALKERFPDGVLALVVRKQVAELIANIPFVDDVLAIDCSPYAPRTPIIQSIRLIMRLNKMLKARDFDVAIDPRGDPRVIWAMCHARIPIRIGASSAGGGFLLSAAVEYRRDVREAEHNLKVAAVLGAEPRVRSVKLCPEPALVEALLNEHPGLRNPFFVVHPGASMPTKTWPSDRFAGVIDAIAERHGLLPVIVGGEDALTCAETIAHSCQSTLVNLAGRTDLRELVALLSRAKLFLGNDSGPAQIAARVGIPTVIVFSGTNDVSVWRPAGENVAVLSYAVDCSPCELRFCPSLKCLLGISVEEVVAAAERLLTT